MNKRQLKRHLYLFIYIFTFFLIVVGGEFLFPPSLSRAPVSAKKPTEQREKVERSTVATLRDCQHCCLLLAAAESNYLTNFDQATLLEEQK